MSLKPFLLAWRTTTLHDREVVDALVDPAHAGPSPALREALQQWPGRAYWSDEPEGRHLILTRRIRSRRRERWVLHAALFLTTLITTTFAGAVFSGAIPYDSPFDLFIGTYPLPPRYVSAWATGLAVFAPAARDPHVPRAWATTSPRAGTSSTFRRPTSSPCL